MDSIQKRHDSDSNGKGGPCASALGDDLRLQWVPPVRAANAGLFVSRGRGRHPDRTIDSYELIFVRSGSLSMYEDERSFEIPAGHAFLLFPGRQHGGQRPYASGLSFYWLHFGVEHSGLELRRPAEASVLDIPRIIRVARPDRVQELFRRFLDDQESARLPAVQADLLLLTMLGECLLPPQPEPDATSAAVALASRALGRIRTHHHDPLLSTSRLASELGCNPDYLGRVFRRHYGITVTEAIHRHRIKCARNALLAGDLTVADIAEVCGFGSTGYFRRIFRRYEGVSPRAFRGRYARIHVNTE